MARKKKRSRLGLGLLVLAGAGAATLLALGAFRAGPPPAVTIDPRLPGIGAGTPIRVELEEPVRGLSHYEVQLVQGERVETLAEGRFEPLPPWRFRGRRVRSDQVTVEAGSRTVGGLREGTARIRVVAGRAPSWLRRPEPHVEELELPVVLRPPRLELLSAQTYVEQGGCEAVVYRVGASAVEDGVRAGEAWFPGFALPGGAEGERFALFAVPHDLDDRLQVKLTARDAVENEARVDFIDRFVPRPLPQKTIRVSESFLARVVPAILSRVPELEDRGGLLANYLMINRELREENARFLLELSRDSTPEFLWRREFLPMRNAKVMSRFADRRTYYFEGRAVDQQDHLGFDLASTRRVEIQAANDGIVRFAGYLGIYGNSVFLDHGYGLASFYGHLSSIVVEPGQRVARGQALGRSGETGLAGGDHLHFTMLLQGRPVDPEEWWDAHWIHDRLKLKLGPALPFPG